MATLVDSNVLLDVITRDSKWYTWSARALEDQANSTVLVINPIIYSEVSIGFQRIEELNAALPPQSFHRLALPWEAGFLAGKCFRDYRARGGERRSPLPDFYIGAHASVARLTLLTRDKARYRTYFPSLELVAP